MAEIEIRSVEALRLAAKSVQVASQPEVGPVVGPLFDEVANAIIAADGEPQLPVGLYAMDERGVEVTVGFTHDGEAPAGLEIIDVPAAEQCAVLVHRGHMDGIGESWMALHAWVAQNGYDYAGVSRELYVFSPEGSDMSDWITELHQPVVARTN